MTAPAPRFLLLRPGAIGDLLLTLPAFADVRHRHPGAELYLVARPDCLPLLRGRMPGLVRTASVDEARWAAFFAGAPLASDERNARADSLAERLRSFSGAAPDEPPFDAAYVWSGEADLLCESLELAGVPLCCARPARPPEDSQEHAREFFFVQQDSRFAPSFDPDLPPAPEDGERGRRLLAERGLPFGSESQAEDVPLLLLAPGAGGRPKQAPPDLFWSAARFWRENGGSIAWIAGPADEAALAELEARARECGASNVIDGAPILRVSLEDLSCVLRIATALLANDSGPVHLAAAVGAPALALFVASEPQLWRPRGPLTEFLDLRDGIDKTGETHRQTVQAWLAQRLRAAGRDLPNRGDAA